MRAAQRTMTWDYEGDFWLLRCGLSLGGCNGELSRKACVEFRLDMRAKQAPSACISHVPRSLEFALDGTLLGTFDGCKVSECRLR